MKIDFKQIIENNNNLNVDLNTLNNEIEFAKDTNITYVFGENGSGKSTICESINSDNSIVLSKEKVELFSYHQDFILREDKIFINKNISEITKLTEESIDEFKNSFEKIISNLSNKNIVSNNKYIKNFILSDGSFWKDICFAKKKKITETEINNLFSTLSTTIEKHNDEIRLIFSENFDQVIEFQNMLNWAIDKNYIDNVQKIMNKLLEFQKNINEFWENILNLKLSNIDEDKIELILKFLDGYNWDWKKCPICDNDVDLKSIKTAYEDKKDLYFKELEKSEIYSNLHTYVKQIKSSNNSNNPEIELEIKKKINQIFSSKSLLDVTKYVDNLINKISVFLNTHRKSLIFFKKEILKEYFKIENTNISIILSFYKKWEKVIILKREKMPFESKTVKLVESLITNVIGENRLNFEINDGNIVIDGSSVINETKIEENLPLSTGEMNFIIIAFSLLSFVSENNGKNEDKILLIDDPISSLDNNNKLNVIYLINYFANNFKSTFKTIIFTHNIDMINIQNYSSLCEHLPNLYILKNKRNAFLHEKGTGFIKIQFSDISFLNLKNIKKFIISKVQNFDFNKKNIKQNILSFIVLLPIMRTFLYINNSINHDDPFHKLLHFNKDIDMLIDNQNLLLILTQFFDFKDESNSKMILEEIIDFFKKFYIENKYSKNNSFDLFLEPTDCKQKYSQNLLVTSLNLMIDMLMLRIFVEKELINNSTESQAKFDVINFRKLISDSNLKDEEKDILKNKNILLNSYIHLENMTNLIIPGIEISIESKEREMKTILKIFRVQSLYE